MKHGGQLYRSNAAVHIFTRPCAKALSVSSVAGVPAFTDASGYGPAYTAHAGWSRREHSIREHYGPMIATVAESTTTI